MENGILQPPWSSDVLGLRIEAQIDSTGGAPNKLSWSRRENSEAWDSCAKFVGSTTDDRGDDRDAVEGEEMVADDTK